MCEKKCFTNLEAKVVLAQNSLIGNRRRKRKERRLYYCKYCNAYHLTSQKKRKFLVDTCVSDTRKRMENGNP